MPTTSQWFLRFGFEVWQVPGVSRAWRYEFTDGRYTLVMDLEGFDLPQRQGPYSALLLTAKDELIEYQSWLRSTRQLINWFRHAKRLSNSRISKDRRLPCGLNGSREKGAQ